MHRPWYYTHVFADPCHGETVYVANLQLWKSTDGGASFTEIQTPHGDNHDLWIDPADPNRIECNDGGACVSCNGGQTWSSNRIRNRTGDDPRRPLPEQGGNRADNVRYLVPGHRINVRLEADS